MKPLKGNDLVTRTDVGVEKEGTAARRGEGGFGELMGGRTTGVGADRFPWRGGRSERLTVGRSVRIRHAFWYVEGVKTQLLFLLQLIFFTVQFFNPSRSDQSRRPHVPQAGDQSSDESSI